METRIREIRLKHDLTQIEFGERLGIKGNTVTNYENGLRKPSNAIISSICREFNISESWLRTGEGEMEVSPPEDIVDRLAREYHLGVAHVALLRAAARVIQEFTEDVALRLIDEIISELRQAASHPQAAADALLDRRMRDHMPDRKDDSSSII